jgi:hypothetical protein
MARRFVACVLSLVAFAPLTARAQAPVRDRPRPAAPRDAAALLGSASLSGRVVDAETGRGIPRARVRLVGGSLNRGPVLTDVDGVFTFNGLGAGTYRVSAERSQYLPTTYPDTRTLRGRAARLQLADGQSIDHVVMTMSRGGVIVGRIADAHGDPVDGARVHGLLMRPDGRHLQVASVESNDLGEFRLPRLPAGRYLVLVKPRLVASGSDASPPLDPTILQSTDTYFPSAASIDRARPIPVRHGETVSGIEMTLVESAPTIVSGLAIAADGHSLAGGSITVRSASGDLVPMTDSSAGFGPDGIFRLLLPPGDYTLEARATPRLPPGEAVRWDNDLVGTARLSVTGAPSETIAIMLGRGATASGRVVFEGTSPVPPSPAAATVPTFNLRPISGGSPCRPIRPTVGSDWAFKVEGLGGACAASPLVQFGRWRVASITINGQNIFGRTITFEPGQHYGDVVIVVTDRTTRVETRVTDASGQPTQDFVTLFFPAEKARWDSLQHFSRAAVSPAFPAELPMGPMVKFGSSGPPTEVQNGVARQVNMAVGDYYAIALDDILADDSLDPAVLERLIPHATKFTLTDESPVSLTLRRIALSQILGK